MTSGTCLFCKIIEKYGRERREPVTHGRPPRSTYRVHHGSTLTYNKGRCQYCKLSKKVNYTQRKCPDCPFSPSLCQTMERDCHAAWHQSSFDEVRALWIDKQENKFRSSAQSTETFEAELSQGASTSSGASQPPSTSSETRRGRPKGAVNKRRRRGKYRAQ